MLKKCISLVILGIMALLFVSACSNTSNVSAHTFGAYYYTEGNILHLSSNSNYESIPDIKLLGRSWEKSINIKQIEKVIIDDDIYFDSDKGYSGEDLFSDLKNVWKIEGLKKLHIKGSARGLFWCNRKLNTIDIEDLDTSEITNTGYMFYACENIDSLEIRNWDTSNVDSMDNMFNDCYNLKTLYIGKWNTSKVTDMSSMFWSCRNLNRIDISKWNTSKVKDMSNMFYNCKNLTELDIGNWNVSNVEDMESMFESCEKLEVLNIDKWNVSKVTEMKEIFKDCYKLSKVPKWY